MKSNTDTSIPTANNLTSAVNTLVAVLESNDLTFPEIMDMKTLLRFLPITRKSVTKLVNEKKIPSIRANGRILFRKSRVLEALDKLSTQAS